VPTVCGFLASLTDKQTEHTREEGHAIGNQSEQARDEGHTTVKQSEQTRDEGHAIGNQSEQARDEGHNLDKQAEHSREEDHAIGNQPEQARDEGHNMGKQSVQTEDEGHTREKQPEQTREEGHSMGKQLEKDSTEMLIPWDSALERAHLLLGDGKDAHLKRGSQRVLSISDGDPMLMSLMLFAADLLPKTWITYWGQHIPLHLMNEVAYILSTDEGAAEGWMSNLKQWWQSAEAYPNLYAKSTAARKQLFPDTGIRNVIKWGKGERQDISQTAVMKVLREIVESTPPSVNSAGVPSWTVSENSAPLGSRIHEVVQRVSGSEAERILGPRRAISFLQHKVQSYVLKLPRSRMTRTTSSNIGNCSACESAGSNLDMITLHVNKSGNDQISHVICAPCLEMRIANSQHGTLSCPTCQTEISLKPSQPIPGPPMIHPPGSLVRVPRDKALFGTGETCLFTRTPSNA